MARRRFVVACAGVLLVWPLPALSQGAQKMYRLGYLGQGSESAERTGYLGTLLENLRSLGYAEGRNLIVESRFADGNPQRLTALAEELVRLRPDVIAVGSAGLAEVLLEKTTRIPIVALAAGQLEAEKSVQNLARPGGNLTGMQLYSPETMGKRLQLLQEVVPDLRRVAVLRGVPFEGPGYELCRGATDRAATTLGIRVRYVQFRTDEDLDRLFEGMAKEGEQGLLVWGNPHLNLHRDKIAELTVRYRLPAVHDVRGNGQELLTYSADLDEVRREGANYVDRIFKGASPAELPIGQPKTFLLIVNLKTAKAIGLTIPQSLLLRADRVIQ